jgi:hypothetical protein
VPVPLRTGPAVALPAASPRPRWLPLPLFPPQINAGEGTIFSAWHPDAEQYYNNSGMDLAFVFNQMTDTHRRYNTVITHGQAASGPAFASANDWGPALLAVLLSFSLKGGPGLRLWPLIHRLSMRRRLTVPCCRACSPACLCGRSWRWPATACAGPSAACTTRRALCASLWWRSSLMVGPAAGTHPQG